MNYDYSVGGNAGGVAAGTSGGWYLAADARSTTIKARMANGTDKSQNLGTLTAGTNYYVFLKSDGGLAASTSSSMANATQIGGFHTMCCSTTGLGSSHPYYNYSAGQIMPTSVWTKKHKPQDTNGGYVYLANYTGSGGKPWVMIYPASNSTGSGNSSSGNAISKPIFTTADTAAVIKAVNYDTMRARLTAASARPLHDANIMSGHCYSQTTSQYSTYDACAAIVSWPGSSGDDNSKNVDNSKLVSEYCAAAQGNPDAGASVYNNTTYCPNVNSTYTCGFSAAGGFNRNGNSMISNVGAWALVGYLYVDVDMGPSQQACDGIYRVVAGGGSYPASSGNAVPGHRYADDARSAEDAAIGARGAAADVAD
jgi:hypothetical protein